MKVFSKEKFFEANVYNCERYCKDADVRKRIDLADGEPVIDGKWEGWIVDDSWTKDGFPEAAPQSVNCRCTVLKEAPPKHPRYKIVIECNDDFTTARMFVDGYPVKGAVAKRNPADKFSWRIGAQTAFNRLWEKKKKPVKPVDELAQLFEEKLTEFAKEEAGRIFRRFDKLSPVVREVKRYAEPGEYIKIVASDGCSENEYKNGDVLKVVCADGCFWPVTPGVAFYKDAYLKYAYPEEYVVLEGYKPE